MHLDHIHPLPPSIVGSFPTPPPMSFFFFNSSSSPVRAAHILLDLWPSLEGSPPTSDYHKENYFSLFQQWSVVCSSLVRGGSSCQPPFHDVILSVLGLGRSWTSCQLLWFYRFRCPAVSAKHFSLVFIHYHRLLYSLPPLLQRSLRFGRRGCDIGSPLNTGHHAVFHSLHLDQL